MTELRDRLQAAVGSSYRIEKELGGGGMSRVFLAEEIRLGRRVVIKVLPPEMAAGVNVDRFEREIQLAAKLQHPHIVPLLTTGAEGDLLYYVMPFIEGESLRAKLAREGELPIGEALRILKEVLDALQYAHSHRVVHRDIKPDNVLLSGNHAVVTDFGVAKAVSASTGESGLTSLGVALGTPAYMAPEQAAADPHVDHRADIYAVGAMAYEMLTGRPPFTGTSAQQILSAHITQAPEPVLTHRETVPQALNEMILRCLAKKAADRWQRADELIPHLDALLTPTGGMTPTGTQPVEAVDYEARARQGHPLRVAALFGAASVAVLAVVYGIVVLVGLPDWVFLGAVGLLALGLPIMLLTGHHERRRAVATMTGMHMTPTGMERHFTWRKALMGGSVAFAGLAVVGTGYMTMRSLGVGPVGTLVASGALDKQERLLLTDFDNASGDSTVGETVTELLRIDLAQSRVLSLLEPSQVREVLERMQLDPASRLTPELAQELATREGIKAYVTGEVRSVGAGFVISARLIAAASGDALVTARETANDPSELIPAVDRLSKHMRERVGESLRTLRADPPLERLTTSSLEALRLYTQATAVADRGDYRRAISLLEEAVARDSTFAMAYRRLGMYKTNPSFRFQMGASGDSALRRAYALRNRLADRERYHVEAAYWARAENDLEKAVTTYLALLEKYPDDAVALNNLAVQYTLLGRFAERDATYRQIIDRRIASAITYTNFLGALRDRGALAQADTILELFAERFPSSPEISQYRAGLAGARKQWADVSRIAEEALRSQPEIEVWAHNVLADVSEVQGKLAEARRLREEAVRRNAQRQGWTPEDRDFLIQLEALELQLWYAADRGGYASRVEQAWRRNLQLTAGRAIQDRRYPRFIYNFILAGQPERARQIGREFSAGLDPALRELPFVRNAFREAEAATLAADGRYGEALDLYHAVRRDQPQCAMCGLIELADAYDRAGQVDSALAYYERYFETQGNRLGTDAAWFARSLKRAGELSEGRDQREKAVEYYNRFVELWSNADAELQPLVADARARIARLVGER